MDLKKQYLDELNQIKQDRIKRIIEVAKKEFAQDGIANTKLSTIAREANVGEASIYRYFSDKHQLIKLVAYDYWREQTSVFNEYLEDNIDARMNGILKVRAYLGLFIELYYYHKDFLKFMEDFDGIHALSNTPEKENEFFEYVYYIRDVFVKIFAEGLKDGSIDPDFDPRQAHSFVSQVLVSTTQKMALRLGYSHTKDDDYAVKCLNATIDMFIQYISNKKAN